MQKPLIPTNEAQRLLALAESGLLNDSSDDRFDRFTRLAQALFGCKISLFTLIDENKQWFKSRIGTALTDTPRDVSFCAHAVYDDKLLYVPDATADPRFADNPLVDGAPAIRLYAGVPLHSTNGLPLGTLCVIDDIPRELNNLQLTLLQDLAYLAEAEIARSELAHQAAQLARDKTHLAVSQQRLNAYIDSSRLATWEWNVQTGDTIFNPRWAEMLGYDLHELMPLSVETWHKLIHPADRAKSERLLQRHFAKELPFYELECRMQHRNGHWVWILAQGKLVSYTDSGAPRIMAGTHIDISERKATEDAIAEAYKLLQRVYTSIDADSQ
jgi:PAS domain S-box-containing protein